MPIGSNNDKTREVFGFPTKKEQFPPKRVKQAERPKPSPEDVEASKRAQEAILKMKEEAKKTKLDKELTALPTSTPDIIYPKEEKKPMDWLLDPSNFLTQELIDTIDINEGDMHKIFFGEQFIKEVKLAEGLDVRYRMLTKKENDDIDINLVEDSDSPLILTAKRGEVMTLERAVVSVNGKSLGSTNEERIEFLNNLPNSMFRIIWNWYLIFDRAVQENLTPESIKN